LQRKIKMTFTFSKSKNYDCLLIPTGETSFGDRSFPVTNEAMKLFDTGKYGCIFITGGHSGFAKGGPGREISEADDTISYLHKIGVYGKGKYFNKIYSDDRSLESVGNFTFPLVKPLYPNPGLDEFMSMMIIGKEGHLWRLEDYAQLVLPDKFLNKKIKFYPVPGEHNNGSMAKVYHMGLMNSLRDKRGAEEIHKFLMEKHPFYSTGWYDKSP
jgi:hypothetical protein